MDLTAILIIIIVNFILTLNIAGILNKQIKNLHKETMLKLENIESKLND